jgi:pimeloyl-ACP methyl ester carboxylesterase
MLSNLDGPSRLSGGDGSQIRNTPDHQVVHHRVPDGLDQDHPGQPNPPGWQVLSQLVADLVAAGYRVITYDNRGCGRSAAPPAPYQVASWPRPWLGPCRSLRGHRFISWTGG